MSTSNDIWKTLNDAKKKQEEIRLRIQNSRSDDGYSSSDDDDDDNRWVKKDKDTSRQQQQQYQPQEQAPKNKYNSAPPPAPAAAPKPAPAPAPPRPPPPPPPPPPKSEPKKKAKPAPAPPPSSDDPRRLSYDDDSEPDYYGFNDPSSDEDDTNPRESRKNSIQSNTGSSKNDEQQKRKSSTPMTAEEAVNLVRGLRKDEDLDISESNHDNDIHRRSQKQLISTSSRSFNQQPKRPSSATSRSSSTNPMSPEEAIKLCLKQNQQSSFDSYGGSDAELTDNNDYGYGDDGDDDGNAGGYFDDEDEVYDNKRNNSASGRDFNTGGSSNNSRGSNKWKKSTTSKRNSGGGGYYDGDNSKGNVDDEWGNNSDLTFRTTMTSAKQYSLYNKDDDTDHDDDEGFYDAMEDFGDGSSDRFSTPTSAGGGPKRTSLSDLPGIKEKDNEDDDKSRGSNASSKGSKGSRSSRKSAAENNWGRRLSNMAMGVFTKDADAGQGGKKGEPTARVSTLNPFQALSSTVTMASSMMQTIGSTMNSAAGNGDGEVDKDGGNEGLAANMMNNVFGRKPKNPPKQVKPPSRELEIIRKCQEQMAQRAIEDKEKEKRAAEENLENIRLRKEEEEARQIVKQEVERYRQTMIDMGQEEKLAKEGKAAADEYDDRLAMEDTLKEQEAKALAMQENMQKIDGGTTKSGDDSDSESDDEDEEKGCTCCGCICCLMKYFCCLIVLIAIVGVPLYFFSNTLEKIPYFTDYIPTWDEVRGGGDDGALGNNGTEIAGPLANGTLDGMTIAPTTMGDSNPEATPVPTPALTNVLVTIAPTIAPITNETNTTLVDADESGGAPDVDKLFDEPLRRIAETNDGNDGEDGGGAVDKDNNDKDLPPNRYLRTSLDGGGAYEGAVNSAPPPNNFLRTRLKGMN